MSFTLGIDPGTKCGWAVLDAAGDRIASGVLDLRSRRHEGGGMRFVRARRKLAEVIEAYPPSAVIYEEIRRHAGTTAAHVYGGIVAVLSALCEELSLPYQGIPVGTVKKYATGKGNASKDMMMQAARSKWPEVPAKMDDNEADALWIAATWIAEG